MCVCDQQVSLKWDEDLTGLPWLNRLVSFTVTVQDPRSQVLLLVTAGAPEARLPLEDYRSNRDTVVHVESTSRCSITTVLYHSHLIGQCNTALTESLVSVIILPLWLCIFHDLFNCGVVSSFVVTVKLVTCGGCVVTIERVHQTINGGNCAKSRK